MLLTACVQYVESAERRWKSRNQGLGCNCGEERSANSEESGSEAVAQAICSSGGCS